MEDRLTEYKSRAEEIRDGWRGTYLGIACVILIFLAYRELQFSDQYVGDGGLFMKSMKVALASSFAVLLFFIKDAKGYNPLEKIRFGLFSCLFFSIFALWFVPFTNRIGLKEKNSQLVWAYVHHAQVGNYPRIGKKKSNDYDFIALHVEVLANEVAMPNNSTTRADLSLIKVSGSASNSIGEGQKIQLRRYQGRWGQAFIQEP